MSNTNNTHLFIVYGLVVLYALCYQLQSPIEPYLVDRLLKNKNNHSEAPTETESAIAYSNLKSFFSIAQSFGSLLFGYILDRWGVRTGLVINFTACATCYYGARDVSLLIESRVPLAGPFSCVSPRAGTS